MNNLQELLLKVVSELKNGHFLEAVERAGISEEETKDIIDAIYSRGE